MTRQTTLQAIDRQIDQAKAYVERCNALERLKKNRDFNSLVIEDYLKGEAIRLVHLKSDSGMQSDVSQSSILKQMDAIGCFNQYLLLIIQQASLAEKAIISGEEDRADYLAEDVNNV